MSGQGMSLLERRIVSADHLPEEIVSSGVFDKH